MAVHMFTNRRIYDSILRRRRLSAQRGTCPVAKKAIFKNCESNQSVICLANANFGLESLSELPVNETLVSVRVLLGADTAESIEEHDLAAVIDQKRSWGMPGARCTRSGRVPNKTKHTSVVTCPCRKPHTIGG